MGIHSTIVAAATSSSSAQASRPATPPTMFPPATDSTPEDSSSQVPWPGRRPRKANNGDGHSTAHQDNKSNSAEVAKSANDPPVKNKKTLLDLIALTISMAGAQIAWTVELGYGTPFLLDLGLSQSLTSLVWLAGPISGLVAQPLIGAISDSSTSRYRRRYWVITSTVVLIFATLGLAYAQAIAAVFVDMFGNNQGRWDIHWQEQVKSTAIGIAVFSFYLLDFALNALQGSLRNLLLDVTPAEQLGKANAWHGRMTHAGNIIGFGFGFLDLAGWRILRPLGGGQFRKVCIVAVVILVMTVWITCITQEEKGREAHASEDGEMIAIFKNIYRAVGTLPRPVRRVCFVQICAFMGWFPFLFYSTTWVGEIMAIERDEDPPAEEATRAGEFALLIYSLVAVIAGTVLPYLAARDARLLKQIDAEMEDPDEEVDAEILKIREMVKQWKTEAVRHGRPLKLPTMPFMLRNIWTAALVLFSVVMMTTFFITTVRQATFAIAVLGICWAVACWVPFAIIMEFLKEMDDQATAERRDRARRASISGPSSYASGASRNRPLHARIASSPGDLWRTGDLNMEPTERTALIRRNSLMGKSLTDLADDEIQYADTQPVAGGTILGIHNLAIVFPQFLIAIISSIIFKLADKNSGPDSPEYVYYGKSGVSWVMRFGGVCALIGAAISRRVPPTKTEKQMRARLAEMRENDELGTP